METGSHINAGAALIRCGDAYSFKLEVRLLHASGLLIGGVYRNVVENQDTIADLIKHRVELTYTNMNMVRNVFVSMYPCKNVVGNPNYNTTVSLSPYDHRNPIMNVTTYAPEWLYRWANAVMFEVGDRDTFAERLSLTFANGCISELTSRRLMAIESACTIESGYRCWDRSVLRDTMKHMYTHSSTVTDSDENEITRVVVSEETDPDVSILEKAIKFETPAAIVVGTSKGGFWTACYVETRCTASTSDSDEAESTDEQDSAQATAGEADVMSSNGLVRMNGPTYGCLFALCVRCADAVMVKYADEVLPEGLNAGAVPRSNVIAMTCCHSCEHLTTHLNASKPDFTRLFGSLGMSQDVITESAVYKAAKTITRTNVSVLADGSKVVFMDRAVIKDASSVGGTIVSVNRQMYESNDANMLMLPGARTTFM